MCSVVELNAVLRRAVEQGASDIHLKVGQIPVMRRDGQLTAIDAHPPLSDDELEAALAVVTEGTPKKRESFYDTGELDIAYTSDELPRFRVNAFRQRGSISFAFRVILAGVLRGVVSQRLLPRVGGGRVAAIEVMVNNARIADLIRDNKTEEIPDAIEEGAFFQMQTFEQALIDLVVSGAIEEDVAANAATNQHDFLVSLEHALKRKAAGITKEEERMATAPQ